jgi:uncharacterized protein (TIGR02118 family)
MLDRRSFVRSAAAALGAAVVFAPDDGSAQAPAMSLNVIYPNREGARFDLEYYRTSHIPLVVKVMGAEDAVLIEGVPNGETPPPYRMIAHIRFASADALAAGLGNPGMAGACADVARFTDLTPTVMIGRTV